MARHPPIIAARRKPRYSSPLSKKRSLLRAVLTTRLQELTNEPRARMRYDEHAFWHYIVRKHGYKLAGWPASIPFTNLSNLRGGRGPIDELLHLWNEGILTFVRVKSLDEALALRPHTDKKRGSRCDLGTHRKARSCHHRGAITPATILAEVDLRMDAEAAEFERKGGRPSAKGVVA